MKLLFKYIWIFSLCRIHHSSELSKIRTQRLIITPPWRWRQ